MGLERRDNKEWIKRNNDFFSSPNIVAVIKWRIMSWAEKVGRGETSAGYLWGKLRESYNFWESGVDARIKLRRIFRKWNVGLWIGIKLVQDRDMWRALLNAVMNLRVP